MAQARRRPPPPGARRPPPGRGRGRPAPPPEEDDYDEELAPAEPPVWERIILSKSFRLVVGATFAAAALAVLVFLIGPGNITRGIGYAAAVVGRQSNRLGGLAAITIAGTIQNEGRQLWAMTATPLPTGTPTATPEPTATPLPTPPPPRRSIELPPTPPSKPVAPGQPQTKPPAPPALPFEAAQSSMREYFQVVSDGDVRRAMQYWSPDAAPEARSALDAAVARGEHYEIKNMNVRPLGASGAAEVVSDIEVTDSSGKATTVQQRYQWRFADNQWFITARLQ
jgi:hypothetical protein